MIFYKTNSQTRNVLVSQKQGHKIGLYKRGKFSPEKVNIMHFSKEYITTKTYREKKDTAWLMQFSKSMKIKKKSFSCVAQTCYKRQRNKQ